MTELYVTKTGKLFYDEDIEALADEAEAGYEMIDGKWVATAPAVLDPPMAERPTIKQIIEAVTELHAAKMGDEPETAGDRHSNRIMLCAECGVRAPCDTMVLLNGRRRA